MRKRSYPVVRQTKPIHKKEYHTHGDFQDSCSREEKRKHPPYVDTEKDIYNRWAINYCQTAAKLLREGRSLSEMIWPDFRDLIEEWLLTKKGWTIYEKYFGGIVAKKQIDDIGSVSCIWLTKKYSQKRKVGAKAIEELEYLIIKLNASRGCIVTTTRLTKSAIELIKKSPFKISYIDNEMLEKEFDSL